jgi:hypothetical protein
MKSLRQLNMPVLGLLGSLVGLSVSCSGCAESSQGRSALFLVLDLSQSVTASKLNLERIESGFKVLVRQAVIDQSDLEIAVADSRGAGQVLARVSFHPGPGVTVDNPDDVAEWNLAQLNEMKKALVGLSTRTSDPRTDLLGVISLGADWLRQQPGYKQMVVFSDLADSSLSNSPVSSEVVPWVEDLTTKKLVPQLPEMHVAVLQLDDASLASETPAFRKTVEGRLKEEWGLLFEAAHCEGLVSIVSVLEQLALSSADEVVS